MTRQRLTVQDAAEVLGVSVDAVRMRVRRGSLEAEKDGSGRVYVRLDADEDKVKSQRQVESSDLVEGLRDQVAYLRDQLDRERGARTEERRRHDTIIAQLTQRIPELPGPEGPPEKRDEPVVPTAGEESRETRTEAPESVERPRGRRWIGG